MPTIPTNDVTMSALAQEFRDSNYTNSSLSSLYRNTSGGSSPPWVPSQIPSPGDVPTSGAISYSNFRGKWSGYQQVFTSTFYDLGGGQTAIGWSVAPEIPMMMNFGSGNFQSPGLYTFWSYYLYGGIIATVLTVTGDYRMSTWGYNWFNHVLVETAYGSGGYPLYRSSTSNENGDYVLDFKQSPPEYTYWTWSGVQYMQTYGHSATFSIKKNLP